MSWVRFLWWTHPVTTAWFVWTSLRRHVNHVVSGHLPVQVSCSRCQPFHLLNHSRLRFTLSLPLMAVETKCTLRSLWPSHTTNLECPPFRLNMLTSRKKKYASLSKASLLSYINFSEDIPHIARPPNPTSVTTEQLQKHCGFLSYPQERVLREDKLRTQTKKKDGLGDRGFRDESAPLRAVISPERGSRGLFSLPSSP